MDIKRNIQRGPKLRRFIKRVSLIVFGAILTIISAGFILQHRRDVRSVAEYPAPGSFVEVDGNRIHYRLLGAGEVTFVLEAGLGDYSGSWNALEYSLRELGRVFVYDRAGLGWSEDGLHPRTPEQITTELHRALEHAQIPKPYILVGHSLGGLYQTLYAMKYPHEVAGLLLIDPSHKDQVSRLPAPPASMMFLASQISKTAPFGLAQLFFRSTDSVKTRTSHIRTSGAEFRALLHIAESWGERGIHLGEMPITVLTAGNHERLPGKSDAERKATWEIWRSLHAELIAASSSPIRAHVVVEGASHHIHGSHQKSVVDAARKMVRQITVSSR